jgi:hypothetical protein
MRIEHAALRALPLAVLMVSLPILAQPVPDAPLPGENGFIGESGAAAGPPPPPPLPANAPQPSPDPHNFEGAWFNENKLVPRIATDLYRYKTPLNAAGQKVLDRRVKSLQEGTPFINATGLCLPMGQPWQFDINYPFQIFQTEDRLDFLFEEYHGALSVVLDPADVPPAGYMGHSIAHWNGDTLVVETTGYKKGIWLDVIGSPASKDATLTQRIRKVKTDHWFLEIVFTVDDPTYYTRSFSWVRDYSWRPDMLLFREYNCELSTGAKNGIDSSLIAEPMD